MDPRALVTNDRYREGFDQGYEDKQREWTEALSKFCDLPPWVKLNDPIEFAKFVNRSLTVVQSAHQLLVASMPSENGLQLALSAWDKY
jgi:hypothetical protein